MTNAINVVEKNIVVVFVCSSSLLYVVLQMLLNALDHFWPFLYKSNSKGLVKQPFLAILDSFSLKSGSNRLSIPLSISHNPIYICWFWRATSPSLVPISSLLSLSHSLKLYNTEAPQHPKLTEAPPTEGFIVEGSTDWSFIAKGSTD